MQAVKLADLFPGEPGVEAWDRLDGATKRAELERMLASLPEAQRQTLTRYLVEGASKSAIAEAQGRPSHEVEADLAAGADALRHSLRQGELDDIEERLARKAIERPRRAHRT